MDCIGRILAISRDILNNSIIVQLEIKNANLTELQDLSAIEKLSITLKQWRKKRSLDANAYCWTLISQIADRLETSKEEVYEDYIQHYAPPFSDDDGYITVTVKADVDMTKIDGHWKFIKGNSTWASYLMLKGSSNFDTAEMSRFINRIVEDAKELGIDTLTPKEKERMMQAWEQAYSKRKENA